MGLLDDAIREHLDLKRRRGADPAEIERAEREALGPVRRNREATADDEPLDDQGLEEVGSAIDEPDEPVAGDFAEEIEPGDTRPEPVAAQEPPPLEFVHEDEEPFADDEEPLSGGEPVDDLDARTRVMRAADVPAPSDIPAPSDATTEYDVDEALAGPDDDEEDRVEEAGADEPSGEREGEQREEGEDMLEETPEFLQDTPDHDRLWFEQRPPRDFDFDG